MQLTERGLAMLDTELTEDPAGRGYAERDLQGKMELINERISLTLPRYEQVDVSTQHIKARLLMLGEWTEVLDGTKNRSGDAQRRAQALIELLDLEDVAISTGDSDFSRLLADMVDDETLSKKAQKTLVKLGRTEVLKSRAEVLFGDRVEIRTDVIKQALDLHPSLLRRGLDLLARRFRGGHR